MIIFCLFLLLLYFCFIWISESVMRSRSKFVPCLFLLLISATFCLQFHYFVFFSVKPCSVPHKTRVVIGVAAKEPLPLPPSFRNQNLQWPISYDCGFWSEHHLSSWISGNSIYDIIVVILIQRTISHIKINTTTTTFIYHTISHYILNHHIPHYTYSIY